MKITGWSIDGFGHFRDLQVDGLPEGLIVIHGPNESGKTTLMDFIAGMLFGFPDRRSTKRRHEPVNGGSLGGRLFVTDRSGTPVTIERGQSARSLQVRDADGERGAAALADLLGHVTAELFDNVFAVDLDALQGLKALDEDAVRDRIFSAGVVGAGQSADRALAAIEARRDALWKPKGRGDNYQLKALRLDLSDAMDALRTAQHVAAGVPAERRRIDDLREQVAAHRDDGRAAQSRLELIAAVEDVWPVWSDAREARRRLADPAAPAVPALDDDYETRLADARRDVALAATAVDDAGAELARAQAAHGAITIDTVALDHAEAIARLDQQRGTEAARRTRLIELGGHISHYGAELEQQLKRLGPDCDAEWLKSRPETIESEAEMRRIAAESLRARAALDRAIQTSRERDRALNLEAERLTKARAERAAATDPELTRNKVQEVAALHELMAKLEQAERDEQTQHLAREAARTAAAGKGLPTWTVPAVYGLAVLAALAGVGGIATGSLPLGVIALVVAAGLAFVAVTISRQAPKGGLDLDTGRPADPEALPASADVARLKAEVAERARALGASDRPSTVELMSLRHDAAEAHAAAAGARQTEQDALQTEAEQQAYAADIRNVDRQSVADADAEVVRTNDAWTAWLADNHLPVQLDPDGVGEFLAALGLARQTQQSLERVAQDYARERDDSEGFAADVRAMGEKLGEPEDDDVLRLLGVLVARAEGARDADRERRRAADAIEAARGLVATRTAEREGAEATLAAVLAEAGAATLDEAEAVLALVAEHRALLARVAEADKALDLRIGARADEALVLLEDGDPLSWHAERQDLEAQVAAAEAERDARAAELTRAEDALEATLSSADVPACQLQVETLRAQLDQATEEWTVLTMAHRMIEATRDRYKRERQPLVVKRAAALFGGITDGRYERLVIDGSTILAVDHAGRSVDAASLSRGTIEQLYLCLRFALAEQLATSSPLPLLLDDILVNSDPGRAPRLARAIGEVAERQQVFMFTCHPWVLDLLARETSPHVIELPSSARQPAAAGAKA